MEHRLVSPDLWRLRGSSTSDRISRKESDFAASSGLGILRLFTMFPPERCPPMQRTVVLCALGMWYCSVGQASAALPAPQDVPPVVGTAIASSHNDGLRIKLTCPRVRWRVVGNMVPKTQWPALQVDTTNDIRTIEMGGPSALAESRVVDVQGNELNQEETLERLHAETPVLVSVSGKMVDPYYLQLTQPDTVVILLGPRDKQPATALLPSRAPQSTTVRYPPTVYEEVPRWRSVLIRGGSRIRGVLGVGERLH